MNTNQPMAELFGDRGVSERLPVMEASYQHTTSKPFPDAWLNAIKLGKFAAELIVDRDYLLNRSRGERVYTAVSDTEEIRSLCGKAAVALGPVIAEALEAQRKQEQLAKESEVRS